MSKEAIAQMMQSATQDQPLQQKLEGASGLAEVVKIGGEKDYQFTEDEMQAFLSEHGVPLGDSAEGELSEEGLDAVAGGCIQPSISSLLRIRGW